MSNIFLHAGIISFIFFIVKFLEMRYIDDEIKPLKQLFRDTLIVYICVVIGFFIFEQLTPVIEETKIVNAPPAFTDNPPF